LSFRVPFSMDSALPRLSPVALWKAIVASVLLAAL
jgi:hypothetical protein